MTSIAEQLCRKMPRLYGTPGAADGPCRFWQVCKHRFCTTGCHSLTHSLSLSHTNLTVQYQFTENIIAYLTHSYVVGTCLKLSSLISVYS
jgi:hypothetical protein